MIIELKSNILNSVYFSVLKSLSVHFCFNFLCINQYETVLSTIVNMINLLHYSLWPIFLRMKTTFNNSYYRIDRKEDLSS